MLRINNFTKFVSCNPTRCSQLSILHKTNLSQRNLYLSAKRLSNKTFDCDDKVGGKKPKDKEKSHPSVTQSDKSRPSNLKLKECKPINIPPCAPRPIAYQSGKKIPSIRDCPKPNLMSQLPKPECNWEEHDKNNKKKGKTWLWIGILFTALSVGAVAYILNREENEKKPKKTTQKQKKQVGTIIKLPKSSKDIPNEVPYLLIGGGTASFSAFRAIKSADPTAKVLVISKEGFYPYMRPPLSKEIWFNDNNESVKKLIFKQWNGSERSLFYEPEDFYTECKDLMSSPNGGVAVARGWSIIDLDVETKVATLDDGAKISYGKCLLATGATPRLSPVLQVAKEDPKLTDRIKIFRNINDFEDVLENFENSRSVAIVGGGFLGSELACAMGRRDKKKNKHIYQIFKENGNMGKILPEYLSYWTTDKVRAEGVHVLQTTEILSITSDGTNLELKLSNGKNLKVDFLIAAVGVIPNTDLAEKSGLEVDPVLGGYLVNTELQARTDLYIAGDCSCFYDAQLGRRRIEHHDHAVVTGRLAGENMTGGRKPYLHQSMFWSDLGPDVGYEAIGIVDSSLPTVGVFAKATDKDNPKAVVTATDEGIRSNIEEVPQECDKFLSDEQKAKLAEARQEISKPKKEDGEDFGKGIIFYLRNDIVVGILLWNVFNRMSTARQVLKDHKKYDDLNEVAKLFNIHEE